MRLCKSYQICFCLLLCAANSFSHGMKNSPNDEQKNTSEMQETQDVKEPQPTWLFRATTPDKQQSILILGSLHIYSYTKLPLVVKKWIESSKTLICEVDGYGSGQVGFKLMRALEKKDLCDLNQWKPFYDNCLPDQDYETNASRLVKKLVEDEQAAQGIEVLCKLLESYLPAFYELHPQAFLNALKLAQKQVLRPFSQVNGMDYSIIKIFREKKQSVFPLENRSYEADIALSFFSAIDPKVIPSREEFKLQLKAIAQPFSFFYPLVNDTQNKFEGRTLLIKVLGHADFQTLYQLWNTEQSIKDNLTQVYSKEELLKFEKEAIDYPKKICDLYAQCDIDQSMIEINKELVEELSRPKVDKYNTLYTTRLRNKEWYSNLLEEYIPEQKQAIVVVGCAHCLPHGPKPDSEEGDKGLLLYLCEQGLSIEQLMTDGSFKPYDPQILLELHQKKVKPAFEKLDL